MWGNSRVVKKKKKKKKKKFKDKDFATEGCGSDLCLISEN